MSLQLIAKQMEAKGRNGDSVLVHMTTGEVAGLQKLAETAGGSLSVNPETGLVEANFLKQMLPTLVGAGVGFMTMNPMYGAMAGAAVGGYQANRAGRDVGEGMVMGGLGGYGGATLGSSLQAAGAPATAGAAGGGGSAATNMATNAAVNTVLGGFTPAQQQAAVDQGAMLSPMDRMAPVPIQTPSTTAGTGAGAVPAQVPTNTAASGNVPAGTQPKFADMTYSQRLDQGIAGLKNFSTEEGRDKALKSMGGSEGVMRMLMMAGLPAMYGARTSVPHPYGLLSADINKRGFSAAEGGEVSFFTGGGTGQGNGLLGSLVDNRPFIIDPVTGNVIRNPNLKVLAPAPAPTTFADMGGRGDGYKPNADFDTPEKQRAYYAENPAMGRFTRTLQDYNPFASLQERMVPGFVQDQRNITYGPYSSQDLYSDNSVERNMNPTTDQGDLYNDNSVERTGVPEGVTLGGPAPAAELQGTSIDGYSPTSDDTSIGGFFAKGGLMGLAKGGLKEGGFVVPADVVAFLGGGNSDNGAEKIERMFPNAMYIDGPDGGQEDTVKTSIEGKQPARVAHGEVYIPPQDVKRAGGAKVLYAMLDRVRVAATGSKKQIKPVSLERAMA